MIVVPLIIGVIIGVFAGLGYIALCRNRPDVEAEALGDPQAVQYFNDVDQSDFGLFQRCYSGSDMPVNKRGLASSYSPPGVIEMSGLEDNSLCAGRND